ncbi:hypothetical protein C0J45_10462 [Silurus meridionalis]|nr:hypothetical protein C0J45_10462 [Silurus meridionalis]
MLQKSLLLHQQTQKEFHPLRHPEVAPAPVTSHLMKIMDFKEVDAKLANILNHLETYQCQLDPTACVEFDIGPPGVFKGSGMEKLMLDLS